VTARLTSLKLRSITAITCGVALLACAVALAASPITKTNSAQTNISPGRTGTLTVGYPDALEYGNARYSGRWQLRPPTPGNRGRAPVLAKVKILSAGSALGGSEYEVKAHNGNAAGTAPVRLFATATTVEPLPHS
jgi:hypothetical protein